MNINEINFLDGEFISDLNNSNYNVHEINDNGYIHFNSKNNYYADYINNNIDPNKNKYQQIIKKNNFVKNEFENYINISNELRMN